MTAALRTVKAAARGREPFLLSTANLNFLVTSRSDSEFRESLLDSDLCTADGMPIVWIARLLGLPIENKVSGSDLFEELRTAERGARPLTVFWFGGAAGVAAVAAEKINGKSAGLRCVGSIDPGFGTVEEMSRDALLNPVNASGADFLVVSLGAKKGQLWLQQNRDRLRSPVRAHLGTVVNFQAGTLRRAPRYLQSWGFEWLWRIKEEPYLWRRYWSDGCVLMALLMKRILPLAIATYLRPATRAAGEDLAISTEQSSDTFIIRLSGSATERHVDKAISVSEAPWHHATKSPSTSPTLQPLTPDFSDSCSYCGSNSSGSTAGSRSSERRVALRNCFVTTNSASCSPPTVAYSPRLARARSRHSCPLLCWRRSSPCETSRQPCIVLRAIKTNKRRSCLHCSSAHSSA